MFRGLRAWHRRHETTFYWTGVLYIVVAALVIPFDVWLAVNGQQTISERIWTQCEQHPILIATGALITVGVCWLVNRWWWLLMFNAILAGHLFWHW